MPRIGVHVSIGGSIASAPERASRLGCDCFQIFAGPPRNWKRKPIEPGEAKVFCEAVAARGLGPVVMHAGYLIHLASAEAEVRASSAELLLAEYRIASALRADGFILHSPHAGKRGRDEVFGLFLQSLAAAVGDEPDDGPAILIENSASASFEDVRFIVEALKRFRPAGVCLDTAHAVAAGYGLSSAEAMDSALDEMDARVGLEMVRVVHANDTKAAVGSHLDRHADIGSGVIGLEGFGALLGCGRLGHAAFILETPKKSDEDDLRNMAALRGAAGMPK